MVESGVCCLQLILPALRRYHGELPVLMAATACLYNLVRGDLSKAIRAKLLAEMVELLLQIIKRTVLTTPNNIQVIVVIVFTRSQAMLRLLCVC